MRDSLPVSVGMRPVQMLVSMRYSGTCSRLMSHPHTQACQCVDSVDVHGAAATNSLSATPSESEGWVNFVLDANQSIQHHRSSLVEVEGIGLHARLAAGLVGVPSVDVECLDLAVGVLLGLLGGSGLAGRNWWTRSRGGLCCRRNGLLGVLNGRGHATAEHLRRKAPCCES